MARHPIRTKPEPQPQPREEPRVTAQALDIDDFRPTDHRPRTLSNATFQSGVERAKQHITSRKSDLRASEIVYVYAVLHERVYGVLPLELRSEMGRASAAVANVIKNEFGGDPAGVIEFLRWTWARERDAFARREPENTFRISWRYQFGRRLMTDYRIALSRRGRIR